MLRRTAPLLAFALLGAADALAQDVYRLEDDDTWNETTQIDPASPEGQLAAARRTLAGGHDERAEHLASRWIERHPRNTLLAEAYLIRGDAKMAQRDYYAALFDYEFIARSYPGSDTFVTALERELEIAHLFASGTRRKVWGIRMLDASEEAEELYIRIQERMPGSRLAEEAGMALGDFYFERRQMELAAEMYDIFVDNYPRSEQIDKAKKRLIYAYLASFKGPEFDAAGLYEARSRLRELKVTDPVMAQELGADALLTRIDESDALKLLVVAKWYMKTNDPVAAEIMIRRLVRTYPRSAATVEAMRIVDRLLPQIPASQLANAPDYAALRAALLGTAVDPDGGKPPPDTAPEAAEPTPPPTALEEETPS